MALRKPRSPQEYRESMSDCRDIVRQMTQMVERMLALTWLGRLREPALYAAAIAFTAFGNHWFALGWKRYRGNGPQPNGLMPISF